MGITALNFKYVLSIATGVPLWALKQADGPSNGAVSVNHSMTPIKSVFNDGPLVQRISIEMEIDR
jgi:hypothetical protein